MGRGGAVGRRRETAKGTGVHVASVRRREVGSVRLPPPARMAASFKYERKRAGPAQYAPALSDAT